MKGCGHRPRAARRGAAAALAGALAAGCGGAQGEAPRTQWDAAAGVGCAIDGAASPFVLSFSTTLQHDLPDALKRGLVIVSYDCRGVRLLPACHAPGQYSMIGVPVRHATVTLATPLDVQINAPGEPGHEPPPAPVSFSFAVGGQLVAARAGVERGDLEGACDGATHFVHSVDLGVVGPPPLPPPTCFSEELVSVAEIKRCGSTALRLHLRPLGPAPTWDASRAAPSIACPGGTVRAGARCALPSAAPRHLCRGADAAECADQCRRGDPASCAALGWMRLQGQGGPADPAEAFDLLRRACDAGEVKACANAGFALGKIEPRPPGLAAVPLYSLACTRGDGDACLVLGLALDGPGAAPAEREVAAEIFLRGCEAGSADACAQAAVKLQQGVAGPPDLPLVRVLFERACDAGHRPACADLGGMLWSGVGGPRDGARGRRLLEVGCGAGFAPSCTHLGLMFQEGEVVEQDFGRAAALLDKGCAGAVAIACRARARMRELALGAGRDLPGAARDYDRGCALGDLASCNEIARLRLAGDGVDRDAAAAAALFRKVCEAGEPVGCHNLANLYERGEGVEESPGRAQELRRKACDAGYTPSCQGPVHH
ncbi:MAG: sel1 repeat family protein [Polyangiaceae bacterium]|nr:sel1 repeat family protein [Polyangiaceae bacterium]